MILKTNININGFEKTDVRGQKNKNYGTIY